MKSNSPNKESSEQEKSDHDSILLEPIKVLFRCSFCDGNFKNRYSRNEHKYENWHDFDLSKIFRYSFCNGNFENSLHRNEHEKRYKPRLNFNTNSKDILTNSPYSFETDTISL